MMIGLLAELGKKLVDRWFGAVLLPGLLYTAAAICAVVAGHRHALDPAHLTAVLDTEARRVATRPAAITVITAAVLLTATAAGLAAQGFANLVQHGLTSRRPEWWIRARSRRADRRTVSLRRYLPHRATPVGEQFYLLGQRSDVQYGLDITIAWPRLWLLFTDQTRTTLQTAMNHYQTALSTCGWALLYLPLACLWWPAALLSAGTLAIGYRRAIASATVLATLIEAATDTHQRELAAAVGIDLPHGRMTRAEGLRITNIFDKRGPTRRP
jgi:hypothetical protein